MDLMLCIMFSKRYVQFVASALEAYACTLAQQCSCVKRVYYDVTDRALSKPGSLLHPCSQKCKRKPIQTQNKHCAALDLCSGEQRTCGNLRYDLQQGCALLRNNLSPYGTDDPNLYGLYQKFSASISTALDYSFKIPSDSFYCVPREFTHISFFK